MEERKDGEFLAVETAAEVEAQASMEPPQKSPVAQETVTVAEDQISAKQSATPSVPASDCIPGESHPPPNRRRKQRKYWMYWAASSGCLCCVKYFIEEEKVDPGSKSDTQGYTVLDFAEHARDQGVDGAQEVEEYLKNR